MSKGKILVVDDEKIVLTGLIRVFEESGYEVFTAAGGKDALDLIQKTTFDIVYTDMVMPEIDGVCLCREIKKRSPRTEVVLFPGTPRGMMELWQDFIDSGGRDELLRKPLSRDEFLKVTDKIMKERNSF